MNRLDDPPTVAVLVERASRVAVIADGLQIGVPGICDPWEPGEAQRRRTARWCAFLAYLIDSGRLVGDTDAAP